MQFDPEIAKDIGVGEAIMYANIEYWCGKNEANNKHFYDGNYWTYNTKKAFTELFPFWTERQIRTILDNLKKREYIKTGNYNKANYDKTLWYTTIVMTNKSHGRTYKSKERTYKSDGTDRSVQPIPNSKPNKKPNSKLAVQNTADQIIASLSDQPIKKQKNISSEEIVDFIHLFERINPTINYGNKTTRLAVEILFEKFGKEKAIEMAKYAISIFGRKYAPVISTPYQLKEKISSLVNYKLSNNEKEITKV